MELLYHYIWQHRLFGRKFKTEQGEDVEVVHPGIHNRDAGPDFTGARIKAPSAEWAGNVEIHVKASDWRRHSHHTDVAYDSVILHVVGVSDTFVNRTDGSEIPQVAVAPPREFFDCYATLISKMDTPRCLGSLEGCPSLNRADWIDALGIERLQQKAAYLQELLKFTGGDWQQVLFIALARALGFGLNSVPFELTAKNLPLNFVMRHSDNPLQVEAMIFGQAGFLDPSIYLYDSYYQSLCREYMFLAQKYNLQPIRPGLWKYSRTRPYNFPHRRLAMLASKLCTGVKLFASITEAAGDYDRLLSVMEFEASSYWKTHQSFGAPESPVPIPSGLSRASMEVVMINVAAPFYYTYGKMIGDIEIAEKGIDLLNDIKAERNSLVTVWQSAGIRPDSAFESQALIHLKRYYCDAYRCLDCRFGHFLLRSAVSPRQPVDF